MTIDEAIEHLKVVLKTCDVQDEEAVEMAIEALSCSEIPNNSDTISRKERKMTDTEMRRREAICKVAGVSEIDDVSDGFHTFRQLYYQRMMLFAAIVRQNKDKAWKSFRHEDGELCFGGGWFIVGIDTPEGSYTYHYEDSYFGLFDCEELKRGKHWDGHTEKDVTRLLSLPSAQPEPRTAYWTKDIVGSVVCSNCGGIREDNRIGHTQWCNCCGCFMRGE